MSLKEAPEGIVINGRRFNSSQSLEIIDMISEGEIEGLCTGTYKPEGQVGEFGWRKNEFERYNTPSGESDLAFLRSVYWNQTSVLDDNGRPNFQRISVSTSNGGPDGSLDLKMGQRVIINESFDPTATTSTAAAFNNSDGDLDTFDSMRFIEYTDNNRDRAKIGNRSQHIFSPILIDKGFVLSRNLKSNDKEFSVRGFYGSLMITTSGKAYMFSLNLYASANSRVMVLGIKPQKENKDVVDVMFLYSDVQNATANQFRNIYIDKSIPSCTSYLILVQTSDGKKDTSASIKSADLKLVRDISGKNKTIAAVISDAREVKNFYLKASVHQSADLSSFKVIGHLFVAELEGWLSLPNTTARIHSDSKGGNLLILIHPNLPQGESGGAYLVVNSKLECGDGMSIRFPAQIKTNASQVDLGTQTSKIKARLSIREDVDGSLGQIPELLGADFEVTSTTLDYEFFFVASRPLSKFRIYITLPVSNDAILINFFQVYKPMIQAEVLLDKSIEIYKNYEISFRGAGKYETETGSRTVLGMPVAIALSNGSNSTELVTTSKDRMIIPLITV